MKASGLMPRKRRTCRRHSRSAFSVTLQVFSTNTSGRSSTRTRAQPASSSDRARVLVSAKFSLQPRVWNAAVRAWRMRAAKVRRARQARFAGNPPPLRPSMGYSSPTMERLLRSLDRTYLIITSAVVSAILCVLALTLAYA